MVQCGGFIYYLEWRRRIKEAGRRHMHVVVDRFFIVRRAWGFVIPVVDEAQDVRKVGCCEVRD